jgi:hypothetical protein
VLFADLDQAILRGSWRTERFRAAQIAGEKK